MRKTIFLYGLAIAILIIVLKTIDYRYLLRDLSVEIYIGSIALIFTAQHWLQFATEAYY